MSADLLRRCVGKDINQDRFAMFWFKDNETHTKTDQVFSGNIWSLMESGGINQGQAVGFVQDILK